MVVCHVIATINHMVVINPERVKNHNNLSKNKPESYSDVFGNNVKSSNDRSD